MNVTLTLGGLNTAASYAAMSPGVSANSTAAAMDSAYGNTAQSSTGSADSLTTQQDSGSSNFTRYTSQYRRLATIVLNSAGRYDHDQQMRAYMELRTMAASGKLQGMQADDQRLWMEVNNNSVSLLQDSDSSDSSVVTSTSGTSTTSSTDETGSTSLLQTSDTSDTSSVNDSDSGDTVDLSPTAQEIIQELQDQADEKLSPLEVLLSQQNDENSSTEVGTVISLTV